MRPIILTTLRTVGGLLPLCSLAVPVGAYDKRNDLRAHRFHGTNASRLPFSLRVDGGTNANVVANDFAIIWFVDHGMRLWASTCSDPRWRSSSKNNPEHGMTKNASPGRIFRRPRERRLEIPAVSNVLLKNLGIIYLV